MISYADAKALMQELEPDYQERHETHRRLRLYWEGRYWNEVDSTARGTASIFRDVGGQHGGSDVGPDMKLVRNLIFDVCVKYQSFLTSLPMIRTTVERPESRRAKAQAGLKENVLYATWRQANMNRSLNQIGWYGPLMGDCFHGIWPDFANKSVTSFVRSPQFAFPVQNADDTGLDFVIFAEKIPAWKAKRMYPGWGGSKGTESKQVERLEYSDSDCFYRWLDGDLINGIEHNLGFNLFEQVPFIDVPGNPWNHGAVEQSVNLVEAGNALYSLMMQAMIENVFPRLILEDPMKFDEVIDFGAGATIGVNQGGKAYFLTPPTATMSEAVGMLRENERAIKQDTSMPDVNFGNVEASVITGKGVNALQGAGTGSLVEMVQGGGIGTALEAWNGKAITIYQRMYRDDTIMLDGVRPSSMLDLNPKQFAVKFKGKDLIGSPRNEVVFSPYIDQHGKLVMALQAQGAGLVSKAWSREQIGISDSEAMNEDIVTEVIDDAVIGAIVAALQADPTPENADVAEAKATSYIEASPAAGPHPLLNVGTGVTPPPPPGAPPAGGPPGGGAFPGPGAGGQFSTPPLPLPPGAPAPPGGAPSPAAPAAPAGAAPSAGVTLQDALAAFQNVQLQGKAYLVGEIVAKGSTTDAVEVAVTDDTDRQPLQDAAQFPVTFHTVDGEPNEQFAEIGSGVQGGEAPSPESLLGAAA